MTRRDRPLPSTVPAVFAEKQHEATRSQAVKVGMPARLAALTKQDAIQMLRESRAGADLATSFWSQPASTGESKIHRHQDLAEELTHRLSPR